MRTLGLYAGLGLAGATLYPLLETILRGFSHYSMAAAGGLALMLLYVTQKRLSRFSLRLRCLVGALVITVIEFFTGLFVNLYLGWHVWDYYHMRANLLGQICPFFSCLWFLLCIPVLALLERLERRLAVPPKRPEGGFAPQAPGPCPTSEN